MRDWLDNEVMVNSRVLYATRRSNTAQMVLAYVAAVEDDAVFVIPIKSILYGHIEQRDGKRVKLSGAGGLRTLTVVGDP